VRIPKEICDHWKILSAKVVVRPERVRVEGIRCIDRETGKGVEETTLIRYTTIRIKWKERWTQNHGNGDITIEWANARLTWIIEDADITILD